MATTSESRSSATADPARVQAFWDKARVRLWPIAHWLWGFDIQHAEYLPDGPVIVVGNHVSYVDPLLVGFAMRRPAAFMAKIELFRVPVLKWFLKSCGAFPVARGTGDQGALETARTILSAGWPLVIFPEGTRNESGKFGSERLRSGVARIALAHRVPIQPVVSIGTQDILPKGAWWPRRVKAAALLGQPLMPDDYLPPDDLPVEAQIQHVNARIAEAIAALLPDDMKVAPTEAPEAVS